MSPDRLRKPLHFDSKHKRLWIRGQRCHHGATGVVLAGVGLVLMVHDWRDRTKWFMRGPQ